MNTKSLRLKCKQLNMSVKKKLRYVVLMIDFFISLQCYNEWEKNENHGT